MAVTLEIPSSILEQMIWHARQQQPQECCGLLAGRPPRVCARFPLRNELASPTRYWADASDLCAAFRAMRRLGIELLAIYHSHPESAALPSRRDLAENYYGPMPRIIISLLSVPPQVRAFQLGKDDFTEIAWHRVEG